MADISKMKRKLTIRKDDPFLELFMDQKKNRVSSMEPTLGREIREEEENESDNDDEEEDGEEEGEAEENEDDNDIS